MNEPLNIDFNDGVCTLTLNRPHIHNAFDDVLINQLITTLQELESREDLRVLVITGAERTFSSGADLKWMKSMAEASAEVNREDALYLARLMRLLNTFPAPTIARVNGHAFGGGVGLIACCDIAIASDHSKFGLTEARLGLVPAVISPYVIRAIGERQARRYFLTAERFDAHHAVNIGLIHELCAFESLDDHTNKIIANLLASGPMAQKECKCLISRIGKHSPAEQRRVDENTADLIARLRTGEEGQEGMQAFFDKRPPAWSQK